MGVIKDIVDIIVPNAQKRIDKGASYKEAIYKELQEIGYIARENIKEEGEAK